MMLGIFWGRTVMTPTSGAGGGAGGASLEQPARALQAAATAQANLLSKIFHRCILEVPIAQARPSLQNVGRGPSVTSITSQRPKRVRPETGLGDIGEKSLMRSREPKRQLVEPVATRRQDRRKRSEERRGGKECVRTGRSR